VFSTIGFQIVAELYIPGPRISAKPSGTFGNKRNFFMRIT
jgi:hypothetical protein